MRCTSHSQRQVLRMLICLYEACPNPNAYLNTTISLFNYQVLRMLIRLYEACPTPDFVDICQCLMFLDDAPEVAKILNNLLAGSEVS